MARIRTIKPEFWDDEKLATISRDARLTFIGMWNQSDDQGSVKGHPGWLKNKIYPYDDLSKETFAAWLKELELISVIVPYSANGEQYFYIAHFSKHQKINHPSKFFNPPPPVAIINNNGGLPEDSVSTPGGLPLGREVVSSKGKEVVNEEEKDCKGREKQNSTVSLSFKDTSQILKTADPEERKRLLKEQAKTLGVS